MSPKLFIYTFIFNFLHPPPGTKGWSTYLWFSNGQCVDQSRQGSNSKNGIAHDDVDDVDDDVVALFIYNRWSIFPQSMKVLSKTWGKGNPPAIIYTSWLTLVEKARETCAAARWFWTRKSRHGSLAKAYLDPSGLRPWTYRCAPFLTGP